MTHFHLYIGQEATGVPLMEALGPDDKIATHHRNHGHVLARGADPRLALAEILGRENGMNRGAGGTMHLSDADRGFLSTVRDRRGQHQPGGAGFATRRPGRRRGRRRPVRRRRARGGRRRTSRSTWRALWDAAGRLVCENNSEGALGSAGGGFPTSVSAVDDLTDIPRTFGIPVETVDGRDVEAVFDVVTRAVEHTRARKGPFFVHVATARYARHPAALADVCPPGETDISMAWTTPASPASTSSGTASTTRCSATRASCSPPATSARTT